MLGTLFRVKVKAEKRQAFIEFMDWDIQVAKTSESGTLRFDLYRDPADQNAFFVYEAYRDKEAFEDHKKHSPYEKFQQIIKPEMIDEFWTLFDGAAVCSLV